MVALSMPGLQEWIVIVIVMILLFGRRLPEVGRNLGKGLLEFKKGLRGVEDDVEDAARETRKIGSEAKDDRPKS